MRRNTNFSRGSNIPSATLNALQDEQLGLIPATDAPATRLKGADGRWWTTPDAGIATATLRVIDTSVDWRQRRVWGTFRRLGAADQRPGQANDHTPNDPTSAVVTRFFEAWTGAGGLGAAGATIANGTPPVLADGQFAAVVDELASATARVYLYANADGALVIYNNSGATLHAELRVWGAGAAPTAGAEPPSQIPTLTDLLWLEPSTAADRPTSPDGASLHRATDTGDVTLWDGAAWRTWSASSDAASLRGTPIDDVFSPVAGDTIEFSGSKWQPVPRSSRVQTVSADHTAVDGDRLAVDASGGLVTVTLPDATVARRCVRIKKIDASANAVRVDTTGGQTIDGASNVVLPIQYDAADFETDGSNWLRF